MNRRDFDPWREPPRLPDYVLKDEADRKATRRLCAGIIGTAVACVILSALGVL